MKNAESGKGPAELRGQFQAGQNNLDDLRARLIALTPPGLTVSHPPTQGEV